MNDESEKVEQGQAEAEREDLFRGAERELASAALLADVAWTAAGSKTLRQICESVLQSIREQLGSLCAGGIYSVEDGGRTLHHLALLGYRRRTSAAIRELLVSDGSDVGRVALHHLELLTDESPDESTESRQRRRLMGLEDTSWLALPIERKGRLVGVMALYVKERRPFQPDEIRLYRGVAAILGNAIANSRLFEAERAARKLADGELKTTTLLLKAAQAIANWTDLRDVARELAEILLKSTSHTRSMVQTWDEERREIEVVASVGKNPIPVQTRWSINQVSAGARRALFNGRPKVWDLDELSEEERGIAAMSYQAHNVLYVPLVRRGTVIGLIVVDDPDESRLFSNREIKVVEGIASHATVAFEQAELLQRERRLSEAGGVLAEISALLAASRDLDETLPTVLERSCRMLGACGSVLAERVSGGWRTKYVYGVTVEGVGEFNADEESLARSNAAETRQPYAVADVEGHPGADAALGERLGYRSYVAYPVVLRDEAIAAVSFLFATPRASFSQSDSNFMRRLAYLISVSMESARLFDAEHRIAETLQEALLAMPERLAGLEFAHVYHSATEATRVGGDFYDLFEIEHNLVGVLIGDVAGKGLKAAALTSLVKNTIRAHAMEKCKTPSQILALTNDVVHSATSSESFVTVFFGILDQSTGRFVYSNAGHTTGALLRGDGTATRLAATGSIVGAFGGVEFDQDEACVGLDDLLFLYTDGLTEARRDRELFGEQRVFDMLGELKGGDPASVVRVATETARRFAGGRLTDDLALLAVRRVAE